MISSDDNKYKKLFIGLIFDALGMVSYAIPGIGEFSDIIWAPISGWLMTRMYKGRRSRGNYFYRRVSTRIRYYSNLYFNLDLYLCYKKR